MEQILLNLFSSSNPFISGTVVFSLIVITAPKAAEKGFTPKLYSILSLMIVLALICLFLLSHFFKE